MGNRGDTFNGGKASTLQRTAVQSQGPTWSERLEYVIRTISGQDVPDKLRAIVWTFNAAIGALTDQAANPTAIAADSTSPASSVALLKATLLEAVGIKSAVVDVESAVIDNGSKIDTANTKLDAANVTLDEIAAHAADIAADTTSILTELNIESVPLFSEGFGLQVLAATGRLTYLSWEIDPAATSARVEVAESAATKFASNRLTGAIYFDPPLPIGNYAISVNPGALAAIVNAGVIL
jgi:hypothetical protein